MAQANFEYFDDEQDKIMEVFLRAAEVLDLKPPKAPKKNPSSGKIHLYFETRDHKRRTNGRVTD